MWLISQHWVEPEAVFRFGIESTDDFSVYQREVIAAIDKAAAINTPSTAQEPLVQDAEQYGSKLNDAAWAAVDAWDEKLMGPMSGAVFNNIKGVVRAAIIKYLEKSTNV